jgi:ABC-type molybdate transport system ATPase subunit
MAVAITAVLLVIVDLDRPDRGLIQISQQPLIDVQSRLHTTTH